MLGSHWVPKMPSVVGAVPPERPLQATTNACAAVVDRWSMTTVTPVWKRPRLAKLPPTTVEELGPEPKLSKASKCSLKSAVLEVPSMIDWVRTGPPVTGGFSCALVMRTKVMVGRVGDGLTGMIVPLHALIMAGPP